jgi:hypothetical protein
MVSGTGIARAQTAAAPTACNELTAAFNEMAPTVTAEVAKFQADKAGSAKAKADYAAYLTTVHNFGNKLTQIASQGSPAFRSATKVYVTDYESEVKNNDLNPARIKADTTRMGIAACLPKGAPATGGGSSAGLQDPALLGAGGAAALAGLVVVALSLRTRSRTSADQS